MPGYLPNRVRPEVTEILHRILLGEVSVPDAEQWVYNCSALETDLEADDFLALAALDYRRADAAHDLRKIVLKYVDRGVLEAEKLNRVLRDIVERTPRALQALQACYDLYCHGYYFLDNLGLGYGLGCVEVSDSEGLNAEEREELLARSYPSVRAEAEKVVRWLREGKVVLTGDEDELGQMDFIDHRADDEKEPTAHRRVELTEAHGKLSAWDRFKKAWGFATAPEKTGRDRFQQDHPEERVAWTRLAADEPQRFVVAVYHGDLRPPHCQFYEVSKLDGEAMEIDDDEPYRTEGRR